MFCITQVKEDKAGIAKPQFFRRICIINFSRVTVFIVDTIATYHNNHTISRQLLTSATHQFSLITRLYITSLFKIPCLILTFPDRYKFLSDATYSIFLSNLPSQASFPFCNQKIRKVKKDIFSDLFSTLLIKTFTAFSLTSKSFFP